MKSRTLIWLVLMIAVPGLRVSAQVLPLGKMPHRGHVAAASCQTCGPTTGGFYGMTIWGTECEACAHKPGLFPPCPNPCQTTLLGELIYDVKVAVDGTLSNVFGCLFTYPCGCRGACTCTEPYGEVYDGECCGELAMPTMITPSTQAGPTEMEYDSDPFVDDPEPTPALQPVPNGSARRRLVPQRQSVLRPGPGSIGARRVSYESPIVADRVVNASGPAPIAGISAKPLSRGTNVPSRYQPRHETSLRRADGRTIQLAPRQQDGSQPALRFRAVK